MKILILTPNDWANLGYELSRCLDTISGYEAKAICYFQNPNIQYTPSAIHCPSEITVSACRELIFDWADVIVAKEGFWSKEPMSAEIIEAVLGQFHGIPLPKEKTIPFHVGTLFRLLGQEMLAYELDHYPAVIISPDLAFHPLAAHEKVFCARPPIDIDRWYGLTTLHRSVEGWNKIIEIIHTPSDKKAKGTSCIEKVLNECEINGKVRTHLWADIPHDECLMSINVCDIHIGSIFQIPSPKFPYGWHMWGVNTLEAMSMGKLVINSYDREPLELSGIPIEECPVIEARPSTLKKKLEEVIERGKPWILEQGEKSYKFVDTYFRDSVVAEDYIRAFDSIKEFREVKTCESVM